MKMLTMRDVRRRPRLHVWRAAAFIGGLMLAAVPLAAGPASAGTATDINLTSVPTQAWTAGESIPQVSLTATAMDGDLINFDSFTASGLPGGVQLDNPDPTVTGSTNSASALIEGTPAQSASGTSGTATVQVTDSGGDAASTSFCWEVSDPGGCGSGGGGGMDVVSVQPIPDQVFAIGTPVSITINASSSTGRSLGYAATGLPAGLSIPNGSKGGNQITGIPAGTPGQSGTATIKVNDPDDVTVSTPFHWMLTSQYRIAFAGATGQLGTVNRFGTAKIISDDAVKAGTSPAIAALSGGGTEAAYVGSNGDLFTAAADINGAPEGTVDTNLGVMPGTSPAITALPGNGFQVAFTANGTGDLWLFGAGPGSANGDQHLGVAAGTSPAIAGLSGGGFEGAFTANGTGHLWTFGADGGNVDTGLGVAAGTSPAIAALTSNGFEAAFTANGTGDLWISGTAGTGDQHLGVAAGTSPAIAGLSGGGFEGAFTANGTGDLWTFGADGTGPTNLGVAAGTSPAITALTSNGFQAAFTANGTGDLWISGTAGTGDQHQVVAAGTSPAISAAPAV